MRQRIQLTRTNRSEAYPYVLGRRESVSVFSFEGIDKWFYNKYNSQVSISYLALWYSWLARRPVTAEVVGSSPIRVVGAASIAALTMKNWGLSSAGRAPALQAGGHRFEPCRPQLFSKVFGIKM